MIAAIMDSRTLRVAAKGAGLHDRGAEGTSWFGAAAVEVRTGRRREIGCVPQATGYSCRVQAKSSGRDDLVAALFGVVRQLKALRSTLPVDSGAMPLLGLLMDREAQRLSDLAATACLDVSTASRHVRALEDAGLVARTTDPDDRRASRISLTDDGHAALLKAHDARKAMLDEATRGWTSTELRTLTTLLQRLADDLSTTQGSHEKTTTEATTTR